MSSRAASTGGDRCWHALAAASGSHGRLEPLKWRARPQGTLRSRSAVVCASRYGRLAARCSATYTQAAMSSATAPQADGYLGRFSSDVPARSSFSFDGASLCGEPDGEPPPVGGGRG